METRRHDEFPHLYRCGHIEARLRFAPVALARPYFRIFIDAATLKREAKRWMCSAMLSDFRIFIDAATLKPESYHVYEQAFVMISASL